MTLLRQITQAALAGAVIMGAFFGWADMQSVDVRLLGALFGVAVFMVVY